MHTLQTSACNALSFTLVSLALVTLTFATHTTLDLKSNARFTLHRNGHPILSSSGGGRHRVRVLLHSQDVIALTVRPEKKKAFVLGVRTMGRGSRLKWRIARVDGNPESWRLKDWVHTCKWTPIRQMHNVLKRRDDGKGDTVLLRAVVDEQCGHDSRRRVRREGSYVRRFDNRMGMTSSQNRGHLRYGQDESVSRVMLPEVRVKVPKTGKKAVLNVAANNRAWVFVNGKQIGDIGRSSAVLTQELSVYQGDVIAVKVVSQGASTAGVIADVELDGKHYSTGKFGWRVGVARNIKDVHKLSKSFIDCGWTSGVDVNTKVKKASGFPYEHGGKYVWPQGGTNSDVTVARLVVGAEKRCAQKAVRTCACELTKVNRKSECYYFIDWRQHSCAWRTCDAKYMCTERNTGLICVERKVTQRIVPIVGKVGVCKTEAADHVMYVPYQKGG